MADAIVTEIEYRQLPEFPGYRIGDDGSVWTCRVRGHKDAFSDKWRKMSLLRTDSGHLGVTLVDANGKSRRIGVHRLVLIAFVGPCPAGMEACHGPDANPANNRLDNLRWDTRLENIKDAIRDSGFNCGENNGQCKISDDDVQQIRERYREGVTQQFLASEYGIDRATVSEILCGRKRATAGGPIVNSCRKVNAQSGAKHYLARITPDQARDILRKYQSGTRTKDLIAEYGIGKTSLYRIVRGEAWQLRSAN